MSIKVLIVGILALVPVSSLYAHDGKSHIADMLDVLPFGPEHRIKGDPIYSLCESVQNFIDQGKKYPPFVKSMPQFSGLSFENHRLFMHWGFNTSPRDYHRLADDFIGCYRRQGRLTDEDVELFWSSLENYWNKERNKVIQNACMVLYGENRKYIFVGKEEKAKAFLTVIYCTHILGDLDPATNDRQDLVEQLPDVKRDINKAIDVLAGSYCFDSRISSINKITQWFHGDNAKKVTLLKNRLDQINNPVEYLNQLKAGFTPFILSLSGSLCDYKSLFQDREFSLKSRRMAA